jgi:hypothetical protein
MVQGRAQFDCTAVQGRRQSGNALARDRFAAYFGLRFAFAAAIRLAGSMALSKSIMRRTI